MRRTLFEAGFNSPTNAYGVIRPQMGSLWSDIQNVFRGPPKPVIPASAVVPPPQPTGTVLGIPTSYVLIGGAVALGLGIVAAIVGSRKSGPPPVAPRRR